MKKKLHEKRITSIKERFILNQSFDSRLQREYDVDTISGYVATQVEMRRVLKRHLPCTDDDIAHEREFTMAFNRTIDGRNHWYFDA